MCESGGLKDGGRNGARKRGRERGGEREREGERKCARVCMCWMQPVSIFFIFSHTCFLFLASVCMHALDQACCNLFIYLW